MKIYLRLYFDFQSLLLEFAVTTSAANRLGAQLRPLAEKLCKQHGWRLEEFLGAGATAAVYKVQSDSSSIALKIFAPRFLKGKVGDQVRARFDLVQQELKDHDCPSLIKTEAGGAIDDTIFMAMQLAPGKCLGEVLKQVPQGEIRGIIGQIATAAKYLEDKKLCHRDIKTDNIVVSDDFKSAILLDLGVIRWLDDEKGAGTDQDGQLPFIATARYSSPEYMFRLMETGPDLWRALTFYQLGGVLHDLIAKERMFEDVVVRSAENRYLVAHAVATQTPVIENDGSVPVDLVLLAQRALGKDPARRLATIDWDDFLNDDKRRQDEMLLGIRSGAKKTLVPSASKLPEWGLEIEANLDKRLVEENIHARHDTEVVSSECVTIALAWEPPVESIPSNTSVHVLIHLREDGLFLNVNGESSLTANEISLRIDEQPISQVQIAEVASHLRSLVEQIRGAFIELSAGLIRKYLEEVK